MVNKKALYAILSLLLVAAMLFTGCAKTDPVTTDEPTNEATTPAETQPEESTAPAGDGKLELITGSVPAFKVVRRDRGVTQDADVSSAVSIRTRLEQYCAKGTTSGLITTDWSKDGKHDSDSLEILVGLTDYEETRSVAGDLKFGDYVVKVVGKKIVVMGYTDAAISYAASTLSANLAKLAVKNDDGTYDLTVTPEDIEISGTKDKTISALPTYEGGTFSAWYDPGDYCEELIIEKTTEEAYKNYISKLQTEGYQIHAEHAIKDNLFRTLYNSEYTINVGYFGADKKARIIIEPFDKTTLFGSEADNVYEQVTTSQITMIGLEYKKSDGGYASNGLCILIRIADGRFLVVDGGFNRAKCMDMLIAQMKAQSADYVAKTGGIKVAGWIITHAHGDHSGAIANQSAKLRTNNVKVERFIINFMSDAERNKSINYYLSQNSSNWSTGEGSQWSKVYDAAASLGSDIVVTHVGHIYYLADMTLETLYTIENYGPALAQAFNTTSLIMKMTFTDPATKKQTVYMSTGDATGPAFLSSSKYYGDYLKSDIVQVAHHGYTTWGTEEGTMAAYRKMAPETLLWPQGIEAYPNYKEKSYNKVLWNLADNPNYKETLVAGSEGTITIFPMPYSVGAAKVTKP